jgi:hypothetical protein
MTDLDIGSPAAEPSPLADAEVYERLKGWFLEDRRAQSEWYKDAESDFAFHAGHPSRSRQGCAMPETVIEQIRRGAPDAEIRLIDGPLATRLRAGISALVGRQVPDGGSYLIAHAPAAPTSYVVRFADGCATHHGRFPERLVRTWLDGSPA